MLEGQGEGRSRFLLSLCLDAADDRVHDPEKLAPGLLDEGRGSRAGSLFQMLGEHRGQILKKKK
jgi:hypothetical protein